MRQLQSFFNRASTHVAEALPNGSVVSFELEGEGGGTWTVSRRGGDVAVSPDAAPWADCRLICSVDDFCELIEGRLRSRDGFFDGRLRVEGDVGLVLRLEQALRRARAEQG